MSVSGHDAQAVTIPIKRQAQLGIARLQCGHQIAQVLGLAGVGVVVGKIAIDGAKELLHLAPDGTQNTRRCSPGNAVAAVDHHFDGAGQADVARDPRRVVGQHIHLPVRTTGQQHPTLVFHTHAQGLDVVPVKGLPGQHHLETVVVARVVAASDLDAAVAQGVCSKVEHGCGDHSHIDNGDAGILQSAHQGSHQCGSAQTPVTAHGHCGFTSRHGQGAKGTAQTKRDVFSQG